VASGSAYVYGTYADIDGLLREQATELDRKQSEDAFFSAPCEVVKL
jgi:hypothetical protein